MGKVKQFMHSLRTRLSNANSAASGTSKPSSTLQPTYPENEIHMRTSMAGTSMSSICSETPCITPSKTKVDHGSTDTVTRVVDHTLAVRILDDDEFKIQEQAEVAANFAMLGFTRKLPLKELHAIGRVFESTLPSLECRASRKMHLESTNLKKGAKNDDAPHPPTALQVEDMRSRYVGAFQRDSRSPIYSEKSSGASTFSFACRSARRIERIHEIAQADDDDDASSFGSLTGWGISSSGNHGPTVPYPSSILGDTSFDDDASSFGSLTGWGISSICDLDPPMSYTESIMGDAASLEIVSQAMDQHPWLMSDAEFDALPDWSDVEEDAEYNTRYMRKSMTALVGPGLVFPKIDLAGSRLTIKMNSSPWPMQG